MIDIEKYIANLTVLLNAQFNSRLRYVGLQGSYLRGEATDHSDIDIMVVIDNLSVSDLTSYRAIIQSLDEPEKSCGFICGTAELAHWNPLEICHLLNTTKDFYGELTALVPQYTQEDIQNFIKLSVNNLYHEICHRYVHSDQSKNITRLPSSYKGVFFILQNLHYLQSGEYIMTKDRLLSMLTGRNRQVLERAIALNKGISFDFSDSFELLFRWCQETLVSIH